MKKILFLLLPLFSMAQKGYKISGTIAGLKDSTLVFLNDAQGNAVAQAYAVNGKFLIEGKVDIVSYFQLGFIGNAEMYEMFIGNEVVRVSGAAKSIKKIITTGSPSQTAFTGFLNKFYPLQETLAKVYSQKANPQFATKKDSLEKVFQANFKTRTDLVQTFLTAHPSSPVSTFLLLNLYQVFGDENVLEQKYSLLKGDAKKGLFATLIDQKIAASNKSINGSMGSIAPEFSQNDVDGKPISLSSFKGKFVLLDFWASWCGPCRKENPNVVAAYNKFKDRNFTILGISLDQDKNKWLKAIVDDMLPWQHVSDLKGWGNAVGQMFQVQSIPQNFLIDPTGKIIGSNLRGEELEKKLEEVLK